MLEVTHNGITEPLNKYQGLVVDEEVNGTFTVSFTSFFDENNPAHELIEEEAIVTVEGYDFRIKQLKESNMRKSVTAISTFYDLVGHRQEDIYGGTRTFEQFADFIFSGTGWTFTSDVSGSVLIPNFGGDNVIKLVQALCAAYECEYKIMPGNHVHFAKEIGPDNDAQYRYGHNVKALSKSVDTTNLRTRITGYGGNGLKVTYTSPLADVYGIIEAEPIKDDRFTIPDSLSKHIRKELTDYPEVAFELDVVELTDKEVGERIWLIYEPMNVEFQTRVLSKKSTIRNGKWVTLSVVLGNRTPKTLSDILTSQKIEIDENAKQTQSRFEQTDDRITTEVESIQEGVEELKASWTVEADGIRGEVTSLKSYTDSKVEILEGAISSINFDEEFDLIIDELGTLQSEFGTLEGDIIDTREEASSNFGILAGQITAAVSTSKEYTDSLGTTLRSEASSDFSVLSGQINSKAESSTVSSLGTRVTTAEQSINGISGEISNKVSYTDYTGQTIISKISQTASAYKIQAKNIELTGAVSVLSDISGNLGTITSGTINIETDARLGNNLYLGEMFSSGQKQIIFNAGARITGGGGDIGADLVLSGDNIEFSGTTADFRRVGSIIGLTATAVLG